MSEKAINTLRGYAMDATHGDSDVAEVEQATDALRQRIGQIGASSRWQEITRLRARVAELEGALTRAESRLASKHFAIGQALHTVSKGRAMVADAGGAARTASV